MFPELIPSDIYELVLKIAALPVLVFLLWLSWFIINILFNPRWQQERRNKQIRKAQMERQVLMEAMREQEKPAVSNPKSPGN